MVYTNIETFIRLLSRYIILYFIVYINKNVINRYFHFISTCLLTGAQNEYVWTKQNIGRAPPLLATDVRNILMK